MKTKIESAIWHRCLLALFSVAVAWLLAWGVIRIVPMPASAGSSGIPLYWVVVYLAYNPLLAR